VAPYVDVLGVANPTTNVTVNGNTANRKREYFHWPLNVPNSTPQYPNLTIVSQYGATQTQTGAVYVAASTESFQPDADGNLVSDGRWTYTWDGENRLVQMIRDTDTPAGARQKLVFEYDHQGRRIRKQFFTYSGGWQEQTDTLFLYDGWNLVAELNANSSNAKVRTYVWGSDLSGSMRGAGGVGGLLKVTYYGAATTNAFVAYDGNGNVAALADAANGNICARYEYGPFAEPIRVTGPLGKLSPLRFSTKYTDDESGFLYYGYRCYNPSTGRWPNRDPITERGGKNLYNFVQSQAITQIDIDGRERGIICSKCGRYYVGIECPWCNQEPPGARARIQLCNRKIENDDPCSCWGAIIGLANFLQGHNYLQIVDESGKVLDTRGSRFDTGKAGEGPWPEPPDVKPRWCASCVRSNGKLSHGPGAQKAGIDASDEEIWECIKGHSLTRDYGGLRYNCNAWVAEAWKACGLRCP
jgi:RHS repeat-associated protein